MASSPTTAPTSKSLSQTGFGFAWLALCGAFALHIVDETATGFLHVWNPTVLAIRARHPWSPLPTWEFAPWLTGLILGVVVLTALSPFAFRNARWIRPLAYFCAVVMFLNGIGHTAGTIAGRTVSGLHFPRPMPGFYSSPFLFATSVYLLISLRRTANVHLKN